MVEASIRITTDEKRSLLSSGKIVFFDNKDDPSLDLYLCCFLDCKDEKEAVHIIASELGAWIEFSIDDVKIKSVDGANDEDWLVHAVYEQALLGKFEGMIRQRA